MGSLVYMLEAPAGLGKTANIPRARMVASAVVNSLVLMGSPLIRVVRGQVKPWLPQRDLQIGTHALRRCGRDGICDA